MTKMLAEVFTAQEEGTAVRCDRCDAVEYLGGETDEATLEGAGWYLGPCSTLCDECNEEDEEDDD
jgi:hypothetical protein